MPIKRNVRSLIAFVEWGCSLAVLVALVFGTYLREIRLRSFSLILVQYVQRYYLLLFRCPPLICLRSPLFPFFLSFLSLVLLPSV